MSILNPKYFLDNNYIKTSDENYPILEDKQLQQNGIDLRLAKVFKLELKENQEIWLSEFKSLDTTKSLELREIPLQDDTWYLEPNTAYNVQFLEDCEIPEDVSAFIRHRSTINRFVGTVTSGWYDSGFKSSGGCGAILRTDNNPVIIDKHFRLAQIIFLESNSNSLYDGQYQEKSVSLFEQLKQGLEECIEHTKSESLEEERDREREENIDANKALGSLFERRGKIKIREFGDRIEDHHNKEYLD